MTQPPVLVPLGFRIIAHRGASAYAPENTMAAFLLAERMRAREVELDVQLSQEGHLVICHDWVLDRYGHPGCIVAEMTLGELQSLDMGSWFSPEFRDEKMLTLDELFNHFGERFTYHVEIKEPAPEVEKAVLGVISSHGLQSFSFITSFHYSALKKMRSLDSEIRIGWLVREDRFTADSIGLAVDIGCRQICPPAAVLTDNNVRIAHAKIPEVRAHHVKTIEDAYRVLKTGGDGLTINHPDWLRHHGPRPALHR